MQINKINYMNSNVHNYRSHNQNPNFTSIQKNMMVNELAKKGQKYLVIYSGPSASGKTTIAEAFMKKYPKFFTQIVTCTTRQPRAGEIDGVHYNFLTENEFKKQVADGKFVECCEVYPGKWYGTRVEDIEKTFEKSDNAIMIIDVEGAENIQQKFAGKDKDFTIVPIFLQPESIEVLEERLKNRGTETQETLNARLARAKYEMECGKKFPVIIQNHNDVDENVSDFEQLFHLNMQA